MAGNCAKRVVNCLIIAADGEKFYGTNYCHEPQKTCPREAGEGYEKCKTICRQAGHAEEIALKAAGEKAYGASAYIDHDHYCKYCQHKLFEAGVINLSLVRFL